MAISLKCTCGLQLRVKDEAAGKRLKCPSCGKTLRIPQRTVTPPLESAPNEHSAMPELSCEDPNRSRVARFLPSRSRGSSGFIFLLQVSATLGLFSSLIRALVGVTAYVTVLVNGGDSDSSVPGLISVLVTAGICIGVSVCGLVGYLCCQSGIRWLVESKAIVYDRTLPRLLALATVLFVLAALGLPAFLVSLSGQAQSQQSDSLTNLVDAIRALLSIVFCGIIVQVCFRLELINVNLCDQIPEDHRWALLETVLGMIEAMANIMVVWYVLTFATGAIGATLGMAMHLVGIWGSEQDSSQMTALIANGAGLAMSGIVTGVFYFAYLAVLSFTQLVRIHIGIEENTFMQRRDVAN
jgi:hypothetical protein